MTESYLIDLVCKKLRDTLQKKNADYGSAFRKSVLFDDPCASIIVRMDDKILRLKNLLESDDDPRVEETICDTMLDLAGYCVLYVIKEMLLEAEESKEEDVVDEDDC